MKIAIILLIADVDNDKWSHYAKYFFLKSDSTKLHRHLYTYYTIFTKKWIWLWLVGFSLFSKIELCYNSIGFLQTFTSGHKTSKRA